MTILCFVKNIQTRLFIRMEPWYHQANTVSIKAGADAPYAALSMMLGEPMEYKEDAADDNVISQDLKKVYVKYKRRTDCRDS